MGLIKAVENSITAKAINSPPMQPGGSARRSRAPLRDQARTIRIPVHMVETINKVMLERQFAGPPARPEEVANEMGMRWTRYAKC